MHWYVNYPESEVFCTPMVNIDFSYPAHLHGCMEVTFCVEGQVEITIGSLCHSLQAGQGILIPPNRVHTYHSPAHSHYYTILFSRNLLPDFAVLFSRQKPNHYHFSIDEPLLGQILEFYASERTIFSGKSLLYRMADAFLRNNPFTEELGHTDELTVQILTYIQENLSDEIHLQDLADHLGYSYYYISKRIHQAFGVSFTELLAQYRIAQMKLLLDSGTHTISQAALAAGFGSIRTCNRVFQQITGMSPSQYLTTSAHTHVLPLESDT